jgi:putative transposase
LEVANDRDALLALFDYAAEHWPHLRTSNPIESTFSPMRATTPITKGPGNKEAGLAMVFKLLKAATRRWRAVNGPDLVALTPAGGMFRRAGWSSDLRPKEVPEEATDKVAA